MTPCNVADDGAVFYPSGRYAAVAIVQGSNNPADSWFHHPRGQVILLAINGKKVSRSSAVEVGALPEGLAFSPDSRFLYVGNFLDAQMQILDVLGGQLVDKGRCIALPGHPASMRAQSF